MGIIVNIAVIIAGSLIGSVLKSRAVFNENRIFAISVMLISAVSLIESIFITDGERLSAESLYPIIVALIIGSLLGDVLHIDERLSTLASTDKPYLNGIIDSAVFFGIGGLQICGSILLAKSGDSSLLYLKSMIDLPFAIMFGAIYGSAVIFSAIPVGAVQLLIFGLANFLGDFISDKMLAELNSVGYIILFFSGFNMLCDPKYKIKNINMMPAIALVIIYNIFAGIWS